jgi:hypothetical protein
MDGLDDLGVDLYSKFRSGKKGSRVLNANEV